VSPYFRGHGLARWMPVIERNAAAILEGVVERNVDALAGRLVPGAEIDLLATFAHYLPVYVIADMLALPKSDHAQFFAWYTAMIDFLATWPRTPTCTPAASRPPASCAST
jgi:cytochrome P450